MTLDPREALRFGSLCSRRLRTARSQEIRVLDREEIEFKTDAVELAADDGGACRWLWLVVPFVAPLRTILRGEWIAHGQIMGHKTPEYQPAAARIHLGALHPHAPGRAGARRELLDEFIAERSAESLDSVRRR